MFNRVTFVGFRRAIARIASLDLPLSWILGSDRKNIISGESGRDGIFAKNPHLTDTSRQSAQLWNSQRPEYRITSPNTELTATSVRPCVYNSRERLARHVLLAKPTGKRPKGLPRPRWSDSITDLARCPLGVEPAELSEIAVDREGFRVLLGLLPSRPCVAEKRERKWMKWITFTFSLFTNV